MQTDVSLIRKQSAQPRVLLAGNPNCGKTTIFNALSGLNYKVANYPGVTVEKKEGKLKLPNGETAVIIDLPGVYSLSGHSIDEVIAAKALLGQIAKEPTPDLIISVVDASNLERNLYLTTQLLDLGVPTVLALNMSDVAKKDGIDIKTEILSRQLDVQVVAMSANSKVGLDQLKAAIEKAIQSNEASKKQFAWLSNESAYAVAARELGEHEIKMLGHAPPKLAPLIGSALLSESSIPESSEAIERLPQLRDKLKAANIESHSFEATSRYSWIHDVVRHSCVVTNVTTQKLYESIDKIILHRFWGSLIFLGLMAFIFQSIFLWASYPMDLIDAAFLKLAAYVGDFFSPGQLKSLIVDGIIPGVGSVVIFVPQIAILFFFLGLLEDSGYLSRAAFLMDKIMRKFGLQGRSFIPLLSSFACAIPGIMATRTIPSFGDRMTTILVAPLMSCSARLPVYALLIAAFVPATTYFGFISLQGLVLFAMYLLGIVGAAFVAWLLRLSLLRGSPALFVMEMPRFRAPVIKIVLREVFDRVVIFLKSAGTVILACSVVLWFLASYPKGEVRDTYAGQIGVAMEPVIKPLGFNWEIGIGLLASFAAREVFVSAMSTVYNLQNEEDTTESLMKVLHEKPDTFTLPTALSLMVFYVFACQCMSTLAVCKRETGSWLWTVFMFSYMTAMAYVASLITYHAANALL